MDFFEHDKLLEDPSKKVKIKRRATKFFVLKGVLYCDR